MTTASLLFCFVLPYIVCAAPNKQASPAECKALPWDDVDTDELKEFLEVSRQEWLSSGKFADFNLTDKQAAWWLSLGHDAAKKAAQLEGGHEDLLSAQNNGTYYSIPGPMRVRTEFRQMTPDERQNFISTVIKLKEFIPDPDVPTESGYDLFVKSHQLRSANAAHSGAGFLPWHREFLFRFENALVQLGYLHGLPYWDSTLDQTLPAPSDSAVWTKHYFGTSNGTVDEPFPDWPVIPFCSTLVASNLTRNIVGGFAGKTLCFSDADIEWTLTQTLFKHLVYPGFPKFENDHGAVHFFVGGHMTSVPCSPTDPVFWMHHAFIDYVWELFRRGSQLSDPTTEYPSSLVNDSIGGDEHEWNRPMNPFPGLVNAHGLSNHYTDYYYRYNPRPHTCFSDADCGYLDKSSSLASPSILWCDVESCRCRAKVRQGGDCTRLPDKACAGPCPGKEEPWCNASTDKCECLQPTQEPRK